MKRSVFYVVVILQLCVLVQLSARDFSRSSPTCLTPDCLKVANEILHYIDTEVNPCDDFYEFACGTFLKNVHLNKEPIINVETIMRDNYLARIRVIIQEPVHHNDSNSMIMAKKMHSACMNPNSKENGVQLIKDTLNDMGGWAVIEEDDWDDTLFDWKLASYKLRQLGFSFNYFLQLTVGESKDDPSKEILQIGNPWSFISMQTPEEEELLYNYMVDIAIAFGADESRAKREYGDVVRFVKHILEASNDLWDDEIKQDYFTRAELQKKFSEIPWLEYIQQMLAPVASIEFDESIFLTDIPYVHHLQNALRNTSKRVLNNFIAWRIIIEHSTVLTNEIAEISRTYYKSLNKNVIVPTLQPLSKICSGIVESTFSLPIQAAYVQRFVSSEAKEDATDILEGILKEYMEEIDDLHWMDYETRINALDRLANISSYVAYPNAMLDTERIEELYLGYQISEDNLLASMLSVNYHKTNNKFRKLRNYDEDDDDVDDNDINEKYTTYGIVYYLASDNSITVPHRMLQDIVYNEDRPKYLNYGALGSFIGHQIFHAIFEGSSIREESQYYDWVSPETHFQYERKLSCVSEHYQNYYVPEIDKYVNSSNTKEEDIADIAGVQLAYKAYKEWVEHNGKEKKLPRLDYSPKQLFWISSAVRFCSKGSPEAIEKAVKHSYQSLKRYRVLGALRNSKDFSKDFHCPSESMMNPDKKCEIW